MAMTLQMKPRLAVLTALCIAAFLLGNFFFRNETGAIWTHPDQSIPIKVMKGMHARGDLDADWARADFPTDGSHWDFPLYRYNFSGYILPSYLMIRAINPAAFDDDGALLTELLRLSRWWAAATLALCLLLLATRLGFVYAILGTLAIAVIPQFYQDAHYARPEAFSTFLFTLSFALATTSTNGSHRRTLVTTLVTSILAGLLTAIKFTYAISILLSVAVFIPAVVAPLDSRRRLRLLACLGGASLAGFIIAFIVGVPGAVMDFQGYVKGIEALHAQYGGNFGPQQFPHIKNFYLAVIGLPLIVLHVCGYFGKPFTPGKYAYAVIMIAFLALFGLQHIFFERNFSLLLPAFVMLAAAGTKNIERSLRQHLPLPPAAIALIAPAVALALFSCAMVKPFLVTRRLSNYFSFDRFILIHKIRDAKIRQAAFAIGAARTERSSFKNFRTHGFPSATSECVVYAMNSWDAKELSDFLKTLPSRYRFYKRIPSEFDEIPSSTLQSYHGHDIILIYDTSTCPAAPKSSPGVPTAAVAG